MSLTDLFSDKELMLSVNDNGETAKKDLNDKSTTLNCHSHQVTSSSTTSSVTTWPTTPEVTEKDQSIFRFMSSDVGNDNIYEENSNAIINKPVIKGDIIIGTSTRASRTIGMNNYGYLNMTETGFLTFANKTFVNGKTPLNFSQCVLSTFANW